MTDEMSLPTGQIDVTVPPSGPGCAECEQTRGLWFHLRRCAACDHIGCCDSSPAQHASAHAQASGHRVIRSYEPGEHWFYDFDTEQISRGPELAPPANHPKEQAVPGPAERVPDDWCSCLHA